MLGPAKFCQTLSGQEPEAETMEKSFWLAGWMAGSLAGLQSHCLAS